MIFPEGTRSKDGIVKSFKPTGVATLLKKCPEALIVPIAINNAWKMVRYGAYPLNTFTRMTWEVLPPIEPEKRPVDEVVAEAETAIKKTLSQ
jgi:1-acyl-sn-glycerol-3-phosphate acyltransferase